MRMLFYPYFSQQDKQRDVFLLNSDSGVKLCVYMANMAATCGHKVAIVLPPGGQCYDGVGVLHTNVLPMRSPKLPLSNFDRRLHWDSEWLKLIASSADLVYCQHETLAFPLRCLAPKLKIITECGMMPRQAWPQTQPLIDLAYNASDAVACNSEALLPYVDHAKKFVWSFGWEGSIAEPRHVTRDIDVLFNSRISATGYTNYATFAECVDGSGWKTYVTDPTNMLRLRDHQLLRESYLDVLHRSKVVVSLVDNGYGGYALQEAIACGAVPVTLRRKEYVDLLGAAWPYMSQLDSRSLVPTIQSALDKGWPNGFDRMACILKSSYSEAWKRAKRDMEAL